MTEQEAINYLSVKMECYGEFDNTWREVMDMAIEALQRQQVTGKLESDCISRQAAIDAIIDFSTREGAACECTGLYTTIGRLPSVQPDQRGNKVNLCDSCGNTYPDCKSTAVLFGDGTGNDNICCCAKYKPKWKE